MIRVQQEPFDAAAETARLRSKDRGRSGAVVTFTGLVRDFTAHTDDHGSTTTTMTLEHYPGMTEAALEQIEAAAQARFKPDAMTIIHRFGTLGIGEEIVYVGVAARHRAEAFAAAMFLVDWLKTRAPFWKLEQAGNQRHWVNSQDRDITAAAQWETIADPVGA